MKIRQMAGGAPRVVVKNRIFSTNIQCVSNLEKYNISYSSDGIDGRWALVNPESKINKISLSDKQGHHKRAPSLTFSFSNNTRPLMGDHLMERRKEDLSFYVVRDDLLHPLVNGNKARKLDAVLPLIEDHAVTDVVTCGGCQSAHAAAVAVSCAERGLKSHLLLRGEQPEILTGYNLISSMYGTVTYVERSQYAKRKEMLMKHADLVAGDSGFVMQLSDILGTSPVARKSEGPILPGDDCGSSITQVEAKSNRRRVVFINEGAGDPIGLFGVIRLVKYLSQNHLFGKVRPIKIVVDAGTGTTAVGIGLGVLCLGLPWEVIGVMLADTIEGYKRQEEHLISDFKRLNRIESFHHELDGDGGIVHWIERVYPRKFGTALNGEVEVCQQIAQQTGILVDPVYTLAAWEHATLLCQREANAEVVMIHTGGTLGMFGMAQRYKSYFKSLQQ